MSFKSCVTFTLSDGSLQLDDPQPLLFSGRNGLIAKFVLTSPGRAAGPWKLGPAELLALAAPDASRRMIVFEQTEETLLERLALESVYGISAEQTEMMFTFRPLVAVARADGAPTWRLSPDKTYNEGLMLEGGVSAPTGSWRWGQPHLALGGVVCGTGPSATGASLVGQ